VRPLVSPKGTIDPPTVGADLNYWDNSTDRTVQEGIVPLGGDCQFITGQVVRATRRIYTLLGESCASDGTTWRLLATDLASGATSNLIAEESPGGFLLNAASMDIWLLPNQTDLLIALPSGQDADTATLYHVRAAGSRTRLLKNVVIDQFPPSEARRFLFSPDYRYLACITRDTGGLETLFLYDLTTPDTLPVRIAGGVRGDRIIDAVWSSDSTRLFIARIGDDNTLTVYDLSTQRTRMITRGLFQSLTPDPDGAYLATIEQRRIGTAEYVYDLIVLDTATAAKVILVEGQLGIAPVQPISLR